MFISHIYPLIDWILFNAWFLVVAPTTFSAIPGVPSHFTRPKTKTKTEHLIMSVSITSHILNKMQYKS